MEDADAGLAGKRPDGAGGKVSLITVVIPTSPIPSHPSTVIIDTAIASIKTQLPDVPITISFDGTENAQLPYEEYKLAANQNADHEGWKSLHQFHAYPRNQSGMLADALDNTATPLLLYWEHDWELLPDVPWAELSDLILRGHFNTVKLHAAHRISPYHEYLMEERVMYQEGRQVQCYQEGRGPAVGIITTRQWSQNPHLASTEFYREKILPLCAGKRDFIENIVHMKVALSPWSEYKTAIFNPCEGDMFRVRHLDGKNSR